VLRVPARMGQEAKAGRQVSPGEDGWETGQPAVQYPLQQLICYRRRLSRLKPGFDPGWGRFQHTNRYHVWTQLSRVSREAAPPRFITSGGSLSAWGFASTIGGKERPRGQVTSSLHLA